MHGFLKECYYRISDYYYDSYFDVNTKGFILKEDLGINHHESIDYSPLPYRHIIKILNNLPVEKTTSTLLDYGCGKGRAIISAAACQYKKVIGMEIANLIKIAKKM